MRTAVLRVRETLICGVVVPSTDIAFGFLLFFNLCTSDGSAGAAVAAAAIQSTLNMLFPHLEHLNGRFEGDVLVLLDQRGLRRVFRRSIHD